MGVLLKLVAEVRGLREGRVKDRYWGLGYDRVPVTLSWLSESAR